MNKNIKEVSKFEFFSPFDKIELSENIFYLSTLSREGASKSILIFCEFFFKLKFDELSTLNTNLVGSYVPHIITSKILILLSSWHAIFLSQAGLSIDTRKQRSTLEQNKDGLMGALKNFLRTILFSAPSGLCFLETQKEKKNTITKSIPL